MDNLKAKTPPDTQSAMMVKIRQTMEHTTGILIFAAAVLFSTWSCSLALPLVVAKTLTPQFFACSYLPSTRSSLSSYTALSSSCSESGSMGCDRTLRMVQRITCTCCTKITNQTIPITPVAKAHGHPT